MSGLILNTATYGMRPVLLSCFFVEADYYEAFWCFNVWQLLVDEIIMDKAKKIAAICVI